MHVHCKNTYRPYRVNQNSVGCLKNVLIMTVTMIKSLIIIVDKIINMVPLDYTTISYSVEETLSYFENYLNFPVNIFIQPIVEIQSKLSNYQKFRTVRIKPSYTLIL